MFLCCSHARVLMLDPYCEMLFTYVEHCPEMFGPEKRFSAVPMMPAMNSTSRTKLNSMTTPGSNRRCAIRMSMMMIQMMVNEPTVMP